MRQEISCHECEYDGMGWFEVNAGVLMQQFMSLAGNGIRDDVSMRRSSSCHHTLNKMDNSGKWMEEFKLEEVLAIRSLLRCRSLRSECDIRYGTIVSTRESRICSSKGWCLGVGLQNRERSK
ncbi:hypothetical protein ACSQ67_015130 [Phaseolus vulgaris]